MLFKNYFSYRNHDQQMMVLKTNVRKNIYYVETHDYFYSKYLIKLIYQIIMLLSFDLNDGICVHIFPRVKYSEWTDRGFFKNVNLSQIIWSFGSSYRVIRIITIHCTMWYYVVRIHPLTFYNWILTIHLKILSIDKWPALIIDHSRY